MARPSFPSQKSADDTKRSLRASFRPVRRAFAIICGRFRRGPRHPELRTDPGPSNDVGGDMTTGIAEIASLLGTQQLQDHGYRSVDPLCETQMARCRLARNHESRERIMTLPDELLTMIIFELSLSAVLCLQRRSRRFHQVCTVSPECFASSDRELFKKAMRREAYYKAAHTENPNPLHASRCGAGKLACSICLTVHFTSQFSLGEIMRPPNERHCWAAETNIVVCEYTLITLRDLGKTATANAAAEGTPEADHVVRFGCEDTDHIRSGLRTGGYHFPSYDIAYSGSGRSSLMFIHRVYDVSGGVAVSVMPPTIIGIRKHLVHREVSTCPHTTTALSYVFNTFDWTA